MVYVRILLLKQGRKTGGRTLGNTLLFFYSTYVTSKYNFGEETEAKMRFCFRIFKILVHLSKM